MVSMKTAICQLLIEGGEPRRNLDRARLMLEEAKAQGCDLALLPESLDFAWTHPSALEEADKIPGVFSDKLCHFARKIGLFVCAGLTEKTKEGNYNTAVLINSKGEIIHLYRKINLIEVEFDFYLPGSCLSAVRSPWGKIGISICSDNYSSALSIPNALCRMGAVLILSPCSWTIDCDLSEDSPYWRDKWKRPFSQIAQAFEIPVLGATAVGYIVGGPYEGKKMPGGSLVAYPDGGFQECGFNEFAGELMPVRLNLLKQAKYKGAQAGKRLKSLGMPY